MKKTLLLVLVVSMLMFSTVSFAASNKQPAFDYKASYMWYQCPDDIHWQLTTIEYGTAEMTDCFDITWILTGVGTDMVTDDCTLYTEPIKIYDARLEQTCDGNVDCGVRVKAGKSYLNLATWEQGDGCSNEKIVTTDEVPFFLNSRDKGYFEISHVDAYSCVPGLGCE